MNKKVLLKQSAELTTQIIQTEKLIDQYPDSNEFRVRLAELNQKLKQKDLEIARLVRQEKQEKKQEQSQEQEELTDVQRWQAFQNALKVYNETRMCFHKNSTPRYFYKITYTDTDSKTHKPLPPKSELNFHVMTTMKDNWIELESRTAQNYLKQMVFGQTINIQNDQGEAAVFAFEPRVYTKLGNTRNIPDPNMYNVIDLTRIMRPQLPESGEIDAPCPPVMRELIRALGGDKKENCEWIERWLYGILVADIGNNQLPMPVWFGGGKIGKNALFDFVVPQALGRELCFSGLWENLDGSFTGFKLGKVFIFIDECPPRDDWSKLKNLTGSPSELIKEKYGPEFVIDNCAALAIGSNSELYPLPMEDGRQMSRVSPLRAVKGCTFAENVVEYYESQAPGTVVSMMTQQGIDCTEFEHDPYELGDKFLRNHKHLWCGPQVVQEFLNYLHNRYRSATYVLHPLRGQDWEEILQNRPNPLKLTVEYVVNHEIPAITINELYEIYQVLIKDEKRYQKHLNNFSAEIGAMLILEGYERLKQYRVDIAATRGTGGYSEESIESTQTTVFKRRDHILTGKLQQDIDRYIFQERVGNTTIRHLKDSINHE